MTNIKEYIIGLLEKQGCKGIKVSGDNINCGCPIHLPQNNTTSFGINYMDEDKGYPFNCFSGQCGASGNLVSLIAALTGKSYHKSLLMLKKQVKISSSSTDLLIKDLEYDPVHDKVFTHDMMPATADRQQPMYDYLHMRSEMGNNIIDPALMAAEYGLYYCNSNRYAGRIIMPIYFNGKLVSFTNRSIIHEAELKSLHASGIKLGDILYGFDDCSMCPKLILVEGPFDLFQVRSALDAADMDTEYGVCALLGSQLNENLMQLFIDTFEEVILMLDDDKTGCAATDKIYDSLCCRMKVGVAITKGFKGQDPCEYRLEELISSIKKPFYRYTASDFMMSVLS